MNKGLLVGAGVFLAGLVLGVVLLGQGANLGAMSGNRATFPFVFEDTVDINGATTLDGTITTTARLTLNTVTSSANVNVAWTSSSTGPVIRAANNTCYRLGLDTNAQLSTTTSTCL